ncbi:hypothetical protein, conserved [Leishmania lindenbergi]|uniref:Uncharacterized protein n=1 Tax=Leishmania lindenbergi TaxID=651832 RepID=A0AAW3A222_9TRYP
MQRLPSDSSGVPPLKSLSSLSTSGCSHNPDTMADTIHTPVCYRSSSALHDRHTPDACRANDAVSCLRRESTVADMRSSSKQEETSVIGTPSHLAFKDQVSLFTALPLRLEDSSTVAEDHCAQDGSLMRTGLDYPFPSKAFCDGIVAESLPFPLEEVHENVVSLTSVLPQQLSASILTSSSGIFFPTLDKGCVVSGVTEASQYSVATASLLLFSSSSIISAASSRLNRFHSARLMRCHSAPALRKSANGHKVCEFSSLPERIVSQHRSAAVEVTSLPLTSSVARHRAESSPTQLLHDVNLTLSSGLCASRLRATTSIPDAMLEEVTPAAFTGVGSHEFSFLSPSSSVLTFIDHEFDINTTDSSVFHAVDGLHGTSAAGSLLDSEGGRRPTGTRRYLLANARSPLLSTAHVMPCISGSTARNGYRPAVVSSLKHPAQLTSEYAAAVQAAAKYGRSLRQILAMRSDDVDGTLRDSEETPSEP